MDKDVLAEFTAKRMNSGWMPTADEVSSVSNWLVEQGRQEEADALNSEYASSLSAVNEQQTASSNLVATEPKQTAKPAQSTQQVDVSSLTQEQRGALAARYRAQAESAKRLYLETGDERERQLMERSLELARQYEATAQPAVGQATAVSQVAQQAVPSLLDKAKPVYVITQPDKPYLYTQTDKKQVVKPAATAKAANKAAEKKPSWFERSAKAVQDAYNEHMKTYGEPPTDDELQGMVSGHSAGLLYAMNRDGVKGVNVGGMVGTPDAATRDYLHKNWLAYEKQSIDNSRPFSKRDANGNIIGGNNAATWDLGGLKVTKQDVSSLKSWMQDEASPERDAAVASALAGMGIHLPNNGTLEQRISDYLDAPERFEAEGIEAQMKANQLGLLLNQAGVTIDGDGVIVLPSPAKVDDYMQRLERFARDEGRRAKQQARVADRRRVMQGLSELGNIFGDMIQASGGAKVFPRDLQKQYDALNERQQKLYDAYWANTEAERLRLAKQKEDADKLAAAQANADKDRKLRKQMADEANAARIKAAQYRSYNYNRNPRDVKYGIYFGTDLYSKNGGFKEWTNTAEGNAVYNQIYKCLLDNKKIPAFEFRTRGSGNNLEYLPHNLQERINMVNTYVYDAMEDPHIKREIVKIALGIDRDFRDPLTANIEDKGKKPAASQAPLTWVDQITPEEQGGYPYSPNNVQQVESTTDWSKYFTK